MKIKKFIDKGVLPHMLLKAYYTTYKGEKYTSDVIAFPGKIYYKSRFKEEVKTLANKKCTR